MANTPQFSVRCPRALLTRIDAEVHAEASRLEGYTRTDIIVKLLEEAFRARDTPTPAQVSPKPKAAAARVSPKAKPRTPVRTLRRR